MYWFSKITHSFYAIQQKGKKKVIHLLPDTTYGKGLTRTQAELLSTIY